MSTDRADKHSIAFARQERIDGPHGWIQWKGTGVCMDIHCECGWHGHIDESFTYYYVCPECNKWWMLQGDIKLVDVSDLADHNFPPRGTTWTEKREEWDTEGDCTATVSLDQHPELDPFNRSSK